MDAARRPVRSARQYKTNKYVKLSHPLGEAIFSGHGKGHHATPRQSRARRPRGKRSGLAAAGSRVLPAFPPKGKDKTGKTFFGNGKKCCLSRFVKLCVPAPTTQKAGMSQNPSQPSHKPGRSRTKCRHAPTALTLSCLRWRTRWLCRSLHAAPSSGCSISSSSNSAFHRSASTCARACDVQHPDAFSARPLCVCACTCGS
jgi:hypothetical protein